MREIVLDTETTGMDPAKGDRIVEIGCVELQNLVPTGKIFHAYLNPERDVPAEAEAVHGLSTRFLADKPLFGEIYTDFLAFADGARLVIHNAEFDVKFLNAELVRVGHSGFKLKDVVDTLKIARAKFPGSPANLDALCRRFSVDNSGRDYHGALLDAELLAEVYLELMGGRQHGLGLARGDAMENTLKEYAETPADLSEVSALPSQTAHPRPHRSFPPGADELAAHAGLVAQLTDAIWKKN